MFHAYAANLYGSRLSFAMTAIIACMVAVYTRRKEKMEASGAQLEHGPGNNLVCPTLRSDTFTISLTFRLEYREMVKYRSRTSPHASL